MQYRVGIDKVIISLVFKDASAPFYKNFIGMMKWASQTRKNVGTVVNGKKYQYRVGKPPRAWTAASRPLFCGGDLQVRYGAHMGAKRGWVRTNGSNGDPGEQHSHYRQLFTDGFDTLYTNGRVTYYEGFIDVVGADFNDYLYLDPMLRTWSDKKLRKGTVYIGRKMSPRSFAIYDKGKQLREKSSIELGHPLLRLEARLRGAAGFPASVLHSVPDPFQSLAVIDKTALRASAHPSAIKLCSLVDTGISAQAAFRKLRKKERLQFRQLLPALAPSWWNSPTMWKAYEQGVAWIDTLRHAGKHKIDLPLGKPVPYSGAFIPLVDAG